MPPPFLPVRARACALTLAVALTAGAALAGCDAGGVVDPGPDPQDAAQAYARALAGGDFADVAFTGTDPQAVTADYQEVVEGMGERTPSVQVGEVEKGEDDTATATLSWSWPLDGSGEQTWDYTSTATLTRQDDEYLASWSRAVVEPSLTDGSTLQVSTTGGKRGEITGARGLALVTERPVSRVGLDRTLVGAGRAGDSARRLAQLVGVDAASYVKQVEASGAKAFVEAIVLRADQVPPRVVRGVKQIKGARLVGDEIPLAPTREFAAPILGSVGPVTAEMVEEDPEAYQAGDVAGLSGLQARYDEQLRGTPGVTVSSVGSDGQDRSLFAVEPEQGRPLALTLDPDLQVQAESLLADVGPASALVAIRPSNGDIVAAANGPGNGGQNLATYGQFAPGSTFKSVSALALLRAGLEPGSTVACPASLVVDGKRFENYDDYPASGIGRIPFRTALANSCNTAFIDERDRLGDLDLFKAAGALGLGIDHDLGFPAYFGNVEPASTETEAAADMIGQGKVLASPMAMATVIASVQRGSLVIPRLIPAVEVDQPDITPLTRGEAASLKSLLRGVVQDGSGRGLLDVPGPPVIAKTGTAEFESRKGLQTHAWMIAAQGDLAVAVFVDVGPSGSGTAGPILEAFLRAARS